MLQYILLKYRSYYIKGKKICERWLKEKPHNTCHANNDCIYGYNMQYLVAVIW